MRVVIQNRITNRYFLSSDKWVEDPSLAIEFENTKRALEFLQQQHEPNLQIVLSFEDNKYNINLGSYYNSDRTP
jgi:hypothetical protein